MHNDETLHALLAHIIRGRLDDQYTTLEATAADIADTILNTPEMTSLAAYAAGAATTEAERLTTTTDPLTPPSPTEVLEDAGVATPVIIWLQDHMG